MTFAAFRLKKVKNKLNPARALVREILFGKKLKKDRRRNMT